MANHNPIGDNRSIAAETFMIDRRHRDKALQVSTEMTLTEGWQVLQENHQAYAAGIDKHSRPLEPMDKVQLGMIEALAGKRVAINVSMIAARQDDDAPEDPGIGFTLSLFADGELLDCFTKTRNRLPASFYAKLDIVFKK